MLSYPALRNIDNRNETKSPPQTGPKTSPNNYTKTALVAPECHVHRVVYVHRLARKLHHHDTCTTDPRRCVSVTDD